jgi:hypothetical protein
VKRGRQPLAHRKLLAHRKPWAQSGQAATEYLVVVGAIVLALIVPVNGGQSAAQLLAAAIRDFFLNFSFMVSVS